MKEHEDYLQSLDITTEQKAEMALTFYLLGKIIIRSAIDNHII